MVSDEEDDIGGGVIAEAGQEQDGFEGSLEGSNSEEEDDVGDGVIGGDDSEVSMETHADGITSPINVLDRYISSSVSDWCKCGMSFLTFCDFDTLGTVCWALMKKDATSIPNWGIEES